MILYYVQLQGTVLGTRRAAPKGGVGYDRILLHP